MTVIAIPDLSGGPSPAPYFVPYLSSYFILVTIVGLHWILLDGVTRRLATLQLRLSTQNIIFIASPTKDNSTFDTYIQGYSSEKQFYSPNQSQSLNNRKLQTVGSKFIINDVFKNDERCSKSKNALLTPDYVSALISVYDHLFAVMILFNDTFGWTIAFLVLNATMNILVSAYYLVLEISNDPLVIWAMEIVWCIFHTGRLIMMVEATDSINKQLSELRPQVLKLLMLNVDKSTRKQVSLYK
ncbi:uncharacterized protein [Atheta coriaria]|uniref:uncharacterized protein n=1 Tax=Dalotia coriaria TaxID=877792 RepID=UPI0031F3DDE2